MIDLVGCPRTLCEKGIFKLVQRRFQSTIFCHVGTFHGFEPVLSRGQSVLLKETIHTPPSQAKHSTTEINSHMYIGHKIIERVN